MNKTTFRLYLLCACGTVAFFCLLQNLGTVFGWLGKLLSVLSPFVVGGILAFVLNIPLARIRPLFSKGRLEKHPNAANALAILTVYLLAFALVVGIILFIVPPFAQSIRTFGANLEGYYQNALAAVNRFSANVDPEIWAKLGISQKLNDLYRNLPSLLEKLGSGLVGGVIGAVTGVVGGVADAFLGLLVSVYILADKKRMKLQGSRIIRALLPEKTSSSLLRILNMTSRTFSAFFSGQLVEAFILGILCFVGMSIFGFPYAPMISVIIGITNMIPIVGPIFGTIPCALLVLLAEGNLLRTAVFVIFVIVLQQLEANIIYPRVVGTQVGLPSIWVLAAVVVGGGLFGIVGMIVGIPALAVARRLLNEEIDRREAAASAQPSNE
ncbi:MAG: AI-2E family transporter [Oscillospiraceae bacterium]|nr:AI-2E family transporter [Oscillospiraceae bacterium]